MSEHIIEIPDYVPPFGPAVRYVSLGEEVVRCRDCVHRASDTFGEYCTLFDFEDVNSQKTLNGFCAWGCRKQ